MAPHIITDKRKDDRLRCFFDWYDRSARGEEALRELHQRVLDNHQMTPDDLETRLKTVTVIDTREPSAYQQEHVAGALNVPLEQLMSTGRVPGDGTLPVVLVCNTGSTTSLFGVIFLILSGVSNAYSLAGGIDGWLAIGGEVERV